MKKGNFLNAVGCFSLMGSLALSSAASAEMAFSNANGNGSFHYTLAPQTTDFESAFGGSGQSEVLTTEFQFTQQTKNGAWHFANTYHKDEALLQFGATLDKLRIDAFSGTGKTQVRARHQYDAVDPFLFHGGNHQRYDFSGFSVARQMDSNRSVDFSYTNVQADNLEDREAFGIGFAGQRHAFSFTQVDRNKNRVGSAFSASSLMGRHKVSFDYMEQINDASLARLSYQTQNKGKRYRVALESARNPLYDVKNENKVVFSMAFDLGAAKRFYAAESNEEKKMGTKGYIFGAIGVGLAVGMSSGSGGGDDAARGSTQHEAARAVLNSINPESVRLNREHGGYIYRNADGSFSATTPILGEVASITLPNPVFITPGGTTTTASYHTHGGPDPRYDNENFSPQDIFSDLAFNLDGYLGTPGGQFKYHNHQTGAISTLGTIAN